MWHLFDMLPCINIVLMCMWNDKGPVVSMSSYEKGSVFKYIQNKTVQLEYANHNGKLVRSVIKSEKSKRLRFHLQPMSKYNAVIGLLD